MTNEEKQLLLIDLCGRLLYGVIVNAPLWDNERCEAKLTGIADDGSMTLDLPVDSCFYPENVKPYLRSMDSMTKEEWKSYNENATPEGVLVSLATEIDWLNANHFDYRGLIPLGLALEAPKDMYKKKE